MVIILMLALVLCANDVETKTEDEYIFRVLDAMDRGNHEEALNLYNELYAMTNNIEYLKEMVKLANYIGRFDDALAYTEKYKSIAPDDVENMHLLAMIYVNTKRIDEAIEIYEAINAKENKKEYKKILSDLYAYKKDFKKSKEYLLSAYHDEPDEQILLSIISIDMANKNTESLALVKEFFAEGTSDFFSQVVSQLGKTYGMLDSLEELYADYYEDFPNEQNALNLVRIYLINNNFAKALTLSKRYNFDSHLIINLYMLQKDYENAKNEVLKIYEQNHDEYYLGILAIIDFEQTQDKQAVLDSVVERLKIAINKSQDHVFLNYLGYLLIDFDIDIAEGIQYVLEALELSPENPAYIDSLAWGYYKSGDCERAEIEIAKIPQSEVENEAEIQEHVEKIKQCLTPSAAY